VKALPLTGNPLKYVHADTLASIRAELSRDPQEFVAFHSKDRWSRAVFCAVA
jgi:hypothetical protein